MSISAAQGVSQARQLNDDVPPAATKVAAVTPFSQHLDAQTAAATGHHHHHHAGSSKSVTSSSASAASAAGTATPSTLMSSLSNLLG